MRCDAVVDVVRPPRAAKIAAGSVFGAAAALLCVAPVWMAEPCVLTPTAISIVIALGPAYTVLTRKPVCRRCGLEITKIVHAS